MIIRQLPRQTKIFLENLKGAIQNNRTPPSLASFARNLQNITGEQPSARGEKTILLEVNSQFSVFPMYAYILGELRHNVGAAVVGYSVGNQRALLEKLLFRARAKLGTGKFLLLKSMGVSNYAIPAPSAELRAKARRVGGELRKLTRSKQGLLDLKAGGIPIGDLVYDKTLRKYRMATLDPSGPEVRSVLNEILTKLYYWEEYFQKNDIVAVICSHTVYDIGIVPRLAALRGIDVFFMPEASSLRRITKEHLYPKVESELMRSKFAQLSPRHQVSGRKLGKKLLEQRLAGRGGARLNPAAARGYEGRGSRSALFDKDDQARILVFCHRFFDAPHLSGNSVHEDVWEWLAHLDQIASKTSFSWYLKPHPDGDGEEAEILKSIIRAFPNLQVISPGATHHQIVSEGVDCVLTRHGSVGCEYPYLGIPVVNSSIQNPHAAYSFNENPANKLELEKMVTHVQTLTVGSDLNELFEYHFMSNAYFSENILYTNFRGAVATSQSVNPLDAIDVWLEEWAPQKHALLKQAVKSFVSSGDLQLTWEHYGWASPAEPLTGKKLLAT